MDLTEMAEKVDSHATLIEFIQALAADRAEEAEIERQAPSSPYGPGARGWENISLDDYLETVAAWAEDNSKPGTGICHAPTWNYFARLLLAGKYYE